MHMCECLYVCMKYHINTWCPHRPKEGIRSLGTRVTGSCHPPDVSDLN